LVLAAAALAVPAGHVHARGDAGGAAQAGPAGSTGMESSGQIDPALACALTSGGNSGSNDLAGDGATAGCTAAGSDVAQDPGWSGGRQNLVIPPAVFWRQIFPAMVLLLATAAGISFGYFQLRREVMRRRAAEVRLEAARDLADSAMLAKSTFFATISHEIRTPLSGIIGMLELLKRGSVGAQQREMLLAVDTAANSLLQILDQVMDFSKAEANRMSLEAIPVDLRAMIKSVIMVMGEPARRRGVMTDYRIDDALGHEILGDPLRIRQILTNLISNATKFTAQGEVVLAVHVDETSPDHQLLRFVVTDTGTGIPPDKLAQVMIPFRQADTSTTRLYGGSGLGLPVCSRLAALMGGKLALSSEPGKGTRATFTCRFPIHRRTASGATSNGDGRIDGAPGSRAATRTDADTPDLATAGSIADPRYRMPGMARAETAKVTDPAASAELPESASVRPPLVLVVDDHAINRDLMQRQLATLGYACDVRPDAPSALEALQSRAYALLLTDCHMPAMTGSQLAAAWREDEHRRGVPPCARLPIVIVTARTDPDKPLSPHVDARLGKPVHLESLREVLLSCLSPAAMTPALCDGPTEADCRPAHRGLAVATLRDQFDDDDTGLRQFLRTSVAVLRADLSEAQTSLCPEFSERFAGWLHRAVGALSMLGHWPVVDEGTALEQALRRTPGAELLPELLPFLQRFSATIGEIESDIERI
jgi:signal transduction histidine kinase/CheY-like chemotaxis protein